MSNENNILRFLFVLFLLVHFRISHPGVKTKLEMLMGSNIVRLTDRDYMLKLMAKFRDNHEKQQQKRIEERRVRDLSLA